MEGPTLNTYPSQNLPTDPGASWFDRIWRLLRTYFAFVGIMVTLAWMTVFIAIWQIDWSDVQVPFGTGSDSQPSLPELTQVRPATLELNIDGPLVDRHRGLDTFISEHLLGRPQPHDLSTLTYILRHAAGDARISGLDLILHDMSAPMTAVFELRRLLVRIREAGKNIVVHADQITDPIYLLASAAQRIELEPSGGVTLLGPALTQIYLGDAIRRLGVELEVVRAGKYKAAFETLTRNAPSPEALEMLQATERSTRDAILAEVATGRGRSVEDVRAWYEQSLFTAQEALDRGIIDAVTLAPGPATQPPAEGDTPEAWTLDFADYRQIVDRENTPPEGGADGDGIALIEAKGEIHDGDGGDYDRDALIPERIAQEIEWAIDEAKVKAVVLRIDSPGGSATAADRIWKDLARLAALKPIVVSMGEVAASGGYWIATPASTVVAEATTITGSIGVIGLLPNLASFADKYGISFHAVSQSHRSSLLNPGTRPTAEDKAAIERLIAETYSLFLKRVSDGRDISVDRAHELGQGRIYSGVEAHELGLVDEIGGLQTAFRRAKVLLGWDPDKLYPFYEYEASHPSLLDCLNDVGSILHCVHELRSDVVATLPALVETPWEVQAKHLVERWWRRPVRAQCDLCGSTFPLKPGS